MTARKKKPIGGVSPLVAQRGELQSVFALPDGTETDDHARYVKAWTALAQPIAERFGWTLYAFNPDLNFRGTLMSGVYRIPVALAEWIYTLTQGKAPKY